jgi:hypothetical protein
MRKIVVRLLICGLGALLLSLSLHMTVAAKNSGGSSNVAIAVEEHPWDILKLAVRIEVLAILDDNVILLVWFDLEEPPIVIQIDRDVYEGGYYVAQKRLINKILSLFLE